ncbi:methyl-accepting chemotaxis protein [Desulfonema ishimotonii]|uniref:Methyl-accepting chemotaxis protein n=1 Tax=Desulfonema ishimotonii TaxID=45657 RepID=A0A401FTG8_9BACT|nr:methyl-accepting chemotaxis protein [Desulfonema ishimotonii]GBC60277.1 methyl-accepting chemotaxis protein [Desulfonema ishimotonii]
MFSKFTVGRRIFFGFFTVLMLLTASVMIAYTSLNKAADGFVNYREMARHTNLAGRLQANMLMVRLAVRSYIISQKSEFLKEYEEHYGKMENFLSLSKKEIQQPERAAKINEIDSVRQEYHAAFRKVTENIQKQNEYVNEVLDARGPFMVKTLTDIMISAQRDNDVTASFYAGLTLKHLLLGRLYAARFLDTNEQKAADSVYQEFEKMNSQIDILEKEPENPERREMLKRVISAREDYVETFRSLAEVISERNKIIENTLGRIGPEIAQAVEDVKLSVKSEQDEIGPELQASNRRSIIFILIIGLSATLSGAVFSFVIAGSINRKLNLIIQNVSENAGQVASFSTQVSSVSQALAERTSEQAAAAEETSASLEEASAMTSQNADNVRQADRLMKESAGIIENANVSMHKLNASMTEINTAGKNIFRIIKAIEDIAFQTNLLALNAAVEASRAGQAGAGFAVVANEIRNLSIQATDAAKNSADLIESIVEKVNDGSVLSDSTDRAFSEVFRSVNTVSDLLGEISAASDEQAQGFTQINIAISELDKVIQENASGAEESAGVSEELNSQAKQMMKTVDALVIMVKGSNN